MSLPSRNPRRRQRTVCTSISPPPPRPIRGVGRAPPGSRRDARRPVLTRSLNDTPTCEPCALMRHGPGGVELRRLGRFGRRECACRGRDQLARRPQHSTRLPKRYWRPTPEAEGGRECGRAGPPAAAPPGWRSFGVSAQAEGPGDGLGDGVAGVVPGGDPEGGEARRLRCAEARPPSVTGAGQVASVPRLAVVVG